MTPSLQPSDSERLIDFRNLTPAQQFTEGTLMMSLLVVDRLEKYSDWLSAGAGAATITLLSRENLSVGFGESTHATGILLIAGSLLFGAVAKICGYLATTFGDAGAGAMKMTSNLAKATASLEEFLTALAMARAESRPRLRLFQRVAVAWLDRRPPTDVLLLPTIVNASVQYLFTMTCIQLLCILGGVVLLLLPALTL